MKIKKGQVLEVEVSDIAFGGKGLAKIDNFAVFIDKAVTGDVVKVKITKKKKRFAESLYFESFKTRYQPKNAKR